MAHREDLDPSKKNGKRWMSYTRRCGFVDWGHAIPEGAKELKKQMDAESLKVVYIEDRELNTIPITLDGLPAFVVGFGEMMGRKNFKVGIYSHYVVRKGLTPGEKESAALGIFHDTSIEFETFQGSPMFTWKSHSSFSGEDLPSNEIGFYAAYRGWDDDTYIRQICGEVSVDESKRIWDAYLPPRGIEDEKNYGFRPLPLPEPDITTIEGVKGPEDVTWPAELRTIAPAPHGSTWVKVGGEKTSRRFNEGDLAAARKGAKIDVQKTGEVRHIWPAGRAPKFY